MATRGRFEDGQAGSGNNCPARGCNFFTEQPFGQGLGVRALWLQIEVCVDNLTEDVTDGNVHFLDMGSLGVRNDNGQI